MKILVDGTEQIRFYRASGEYGFLSNLYRSAFEFEGRIWHTAEHAYQFGKPADLKVAEWIVSAPKPHLVAAAAHALLTFDVRPGWSEIKVDRMRAIIRAKFETNLDLAVALANTHPAILLEDSKTDAFWGLGRKGNGKNMLGVLLMEFRESLRPTPKRRRKCK